MKIEKLSAIVLIVGLLCLAAFIRLQGITNVPSGQLTESDGYFYYWQAQLISEHGKLPERDMNRWLPLGRDLTQTLNLYGYVLAYAHKGIASDIPGHYTLSRYHLHTRRLLLHWTRCPLSLFLSHFRYPLFKHRWCASGNTPWCD